MSMQIFTRLNVAKYCLGLLLSIISTSLLGQTTITFDDQGYAHDADLGKTVTIGNLAFSVRDENLQEHASGSDIYYESASEGNGFGGSGLLYVGDQFNSDDPVYFIIKTVDGTARDFQSLYIFDYLLISIEVNLTAEAYRDGTFLGTQDLIIPASSKATYTLDPVFDNVDEIRIRQQTPLKYAGYPGVLFAFDHFVIGSASVNDPPVVSGLPASIEIIEDTNGELDIASSTFSDEDSDEITVTLSVSKGTIALAATGGRPVTLGGNGTSSITVAGAPDAVNGYIGVPSNIVYMPPAGLNGSPAALLTVSANDGDGSGDVELGTVPINITGTNDAPLITTSGGSTIFAEPYSGSPVPVVIDNTLTVADPDNATLASATIAITGNFQSGEDLLGFTSDGGTMGNIAGTYEASTGILTLTSAGAAATLAEWQAALRAVTYSNSSSNPATVNRTITFVAYDGTANSAGATKAVSVQAVNTIPLVANLDGDNVTFTEGGSAVLLDAGADATVSDPDTPNPDDGYVVVHIINGVVGEDMLSIRHEGMGAGQIGVVGGDLHYDGTHIGMITGAGTSSMSVEFLPTATFAAAQALIRNLVYLNSSTNPSLDPRRIRISLNDGVDRVSSLNDVTVNVKALNNAPVVTTSDGATTFTESFYGGSTQAVIDNALTVTDPGNTTIASATVSITGNFQSGEDVLRFTGDDATMGNITGSYNAGTGVLSLVSAGSAATLAEWQAALRAVTYDNGSHTPNTASRTASFVVSNGSEDSNPATKTIDVVAVNSKPVAVDDAFTTSEGVPVTGNIRTNDSDPDGDQLVAALVTAPPISLGSVLLLADGRFTYTPTSANHGGLAKMQYQVYDYAFVADTAWVYVTVEGVNDAPEVTAPATIDIDEDVAGPLPGISFADADAGSSSVTATFSAASGTFAATSGGGVTVGGSGTGSLTLAGPIADLNTFIAANNLTFTTALNATDNVTFTVNIDDGGNTGADPGNSGTSSSEADMTAVTLFVKAINDAPLNAVPAPQSIDGDESLIFSTGNSNLVSVSDADAGVSSIQVKLTATNGLVTLAGATRLIFISGDGTDDGTMAFYGTIADINQALNGMIFQPTAGFSGAASLQIATSDLGSSGSGESLTDTDLINIAVNPINPVITTLNASRPDGVYKLDEVIPVTITFNQAIDVNGGVPSILLETGATDRQAVYSSGSGSNTLTFNYTVQAGDLSADLDYASTAALALNGATVQSGSGMDAVLTLPVPGGAGSIAGQHDIVVDGVKPVVSSAGVPADGYYLEDDVLSFTINFDENVMVDFGGGTPYLELIIASATVHAEYISGSGTSALAFQYTVQAGEQDLDGIELGTSIVLNGGVIKDAAGNDAGLTLYNAAPTNGVFIYAITPGVTLSTTVVSPVNQEFTVTVEFTEPVSDFTLGDLTVANAGLSSINTADNITYTALVTPLTDGPVSIQVPADAARNIGDKGNTASNVLNLIYDGTAPAVTSVSVPANSIYGSGDVLTFTVNYNENVIVNTLGGTPSMELTIGTTPVQVLYTGGSGTNALTFDYTVQDGELDADGVSPGADIALNGATIRDAATNNASLTLAGMDDTGGVLVDAAGPVVSSVNVPADAYYQEGDVLRFTVNFNEHVIANAGGGTPYLELTIGSATMRADYVSSAGAHALVFQYTVQAGDQDLDGIALGNSIVMNGGVIRDAIGNDAVAALNNAAPTDNVFVYSVLPGVTLSTTAVSPVNQAFTLNIVFTEAVTGFDLTDITIVNATLSNLQTADNITYTSLVTPSAAGTVSLSVPAGAAQNIANHANTASNTLNVTYDDAAPVIPQGLAAQPLNGQHVINWTANTESDLAAYALYGATTPNPTALLTRIDAPATTYTHTGVAAGVTWYYRLAAIDEAGNESGLSEEVTAVVKIDQEITFAPTASVTYGTADFDPGASSTNNSIEIVYTSSDETIASIVAGRIHIKKAGTVTITASQEGDALYNEATPREQILSIGKAALTITAENKSRKYGEANPPFTFTYKGFVNGEDENQLSTPPSASTEATPLSSPGEYPVIAAGATAANYTLRYVNGTLTIAPAARSLTFDPLPEKTYGDADFDPVAEANTDETVIYSSSNTAVAEIADGKIRIAGAGTAIITATLAENANYSNTPEISRELLVKKAPQEIHFAEIGQVQRDAGTLQLEVSASSGLPVQLEVSNNLVATLTGPSDLQVLRLGSTMITATQPGNANYLPAAPVERELLVIDEAGLRVRVHKVVSPNSDGINDFLIIEGVNDFPDNRLVVVDRNGVLLFDTKGYDNGNNVFHGRANTRVIGENLPSGTYFYLLEYRTGSQTQRLKGWFVLKY